MENVRQHVSESAARNIERWLTEPKYIEYKPELEKCIANQQWRLLEDSFFKVIEFGTAGRRGTTGIGSNRINRVTIGESAQALCEYAAEADRDAKTKGIVIACDTRLSSKELSEFAATVCAANGFKTYLFDSYRSTPELSFSVRHLGAIAGIVISASHNPPADNGFKVCWTDGGQLVAPHDKGVLAKAEQGGEILQIDFEDALTSGLITLIGESVDNAYIEAAASEAESNVRDIDIVYSPLHGAGQTNVLPVLKKAGFNRIKTVEDQMTPDGNFPTVPSGKPNPEEPEANDRAVALMMARRADIAITNDPDADRIGVMVRQGDEVRYLSGNQSAALATDFVLSKLESRSELTAKHYVAKTIVTTELITSITNRYGATLYTNMLIGFKYIGDLIRRKENTGEIFIIGGEESYGLLKGTYARDKDGATGALPLAECAAELKRVGKTLYDRLLELYVEHGVYRERLDNAYFEGASGFARMQSVMDGLRSNPPATVEGATVTAIQDYQSLKRTELKNGVVSEIDCATGNVIVLEFNEDSRCRVTVRPSGTEPKIKLYVQWYEDATEDISSQIETIDEFTEGISRTLEGMLLQ